MAYKLRCSLRIISFTDNHWDGEGRGRADVYVAAIAALQYQDIEALPALRDDFQFESSRRAGK